MLPHRLVHRRICASCRLRASIASKAFARSRKSLLLQPSASRPLTTSRRLYQSIDNAPQQRTEAGDAIIEGVEEERSPEQAARSAREAFGDALPEGVLSEEEYRVYERLYGKPLAWTGREEVAIEDEDAVDAEEAGTGVLKESQDGALEEVEFEAEEIVEEDSDEGTDGADLRLADDIDAAMGDPILEEAVAEEVEEPSYQRAHPLTLQNRFGTSPTTLPLPIETLIKPIASQLSPISNTHLKQTAHRTFGGLGLPSSTSTPTIAKPLEQKSIPLEASQSQMSEIEGDIFMACLVPGVYASTMSVLTETRKRLGTAWAEEMVEKAKEGELRILDAGGAGAGVLAVREMLRAEWERMHEESTSPESTMSLAEADGKVGGSTATPPLGHATVLAASDALKKRASFLLDNTTFIPRLPNYLHTDSAKKKGKFDIIIAPHTLWGLKEDYIRKTHLQNLWSMLSTDGGILVLLEKGVSRGFEIVAGARQMLLDNCISPPSNDTSSESKTVLEGREKELATILAPCPNHSACPMYSPPGQVKGRRDICHFSQRYIRPSFLQTILGARDKNFEDVKFSYLSVMRGKDLVQEQSITQTAEATDEAFSGYENADHQAVNSLSLPRAILPPLKKKGHVILDLCTPAGTLERWTVPRSFSRQAFRDARKSSWGDLWALGAKSRVPRTPKIKKRKPKTNESEREAEMADEEYEWSGDTFDDIVGEKTIARRVAGKVRNGRKIKGIRDKRDKKADGNGRRRLGDGEVD